MFFFGGCGISAEVGLLGLEELKAKRMYIAYEALEMGFGDEKIST